MTQQLTHTARVVANTRLTANQHLLTFHCPQLAASAQPGQFVMLASNQFLRRPLGIAATDPQAGTFSVGGRAKGEGMAHLLQLQPGDLVDTLGPLGNEFSTDNISHAILVGGGTGVYPLLFLAANLNRRKIPVTVALGFRSAAEAILLPEFTAVSDRLVVASQAGDTEIAGTVLDAVSIITAQADDAKTTGNSPVDTPPTVFTVGPTPMMAAVNQMATARHWPVQASFEERMACGVGICVGCATKINDRHSPTGFTYKRCCVDGPVFAGQDIAWQ